MKKLILAFLLTLTLFASGVANAWITTRTAEGYNGLSQTIEAVTNPENRVIAVYNDFNNMKWVIAPTHWTFPASVNDDIVAAYQWANANGQPWRWGKIYWPSNGGKPCLLVEETFNNHKYSHPICY